ncbi:DNA-binding transcriptional MerR regulator [Mycetocola sp. CAN_C7]|uniref:transcriptional regulator FtsR n=1 Tax=Mycetocola sp. CAN_C7 TaxID=2787724 RepID=UPI0018CAAE5C
MTAQAAHRSYDPRDAGQAKSSGKTAAPQLLSIGQVLARLAKEFPELSNSKLRFLEEQGLVSPSRTKSGYRKFSPQDVERLRLILSMQRDHYLPLKVIRGHLADLDAGRAPALPGAAANGQISTIIPAGRRYQRDDVLRETGATPALFSDAISASVITPAESYGDDTVSVIRSLVALQRCGIEPRHLRGYRATAEREVSMIESALLPIARRKDAASRARAAELSGEIAGQLDVIRASLVRSALGRLLS